jgi:hypothetical protein
MSAIRSAQFAKGRTMKTAREWFNEPEREWAEVGCEACALMPDGDLTEEQAKTATLCGDCEAYFGLGGN